MAKRLRSGWVLSVAFCLLSASAHSLPLGPEVQVSPATGEHHFPAAVGTPDGFVVTWERAGDPPADDEVFARLLDPLAGPMGAAFQVNAYTTYAQGQTRVAGWDDGSFVVLWSQCCDLGFGAELRARIYEASGTPRTQDFQVETTNYLEIFPSHDLATTPSGDFVVARSALDLSSDLGSVDRMRFDSAGTPIDEAPLKQENDQVYESRIVSTASGFAVVWQGADYFFPDTNENEWRSLNALGVPTGNAVDVHPSQSFREGTSIDGRSTLDGDFLVVWTGNGVGAGENDVYGRRLAVGGGSSSAIQRLNEFTAGVHETARVARDSDGQFLVVWDSDGAPGEEGQGIRGRYLDADGSPLGSEFGVNEFTTGTQNRPDVTASADGRSFLVVWESENGRVQGRRFSSVSGLFFDGFESGDASAWDSAVP